MTGKRFTIKNIWGKSLNRLIGVICDDNKDMYMTDVCELLNTLSEENEQLKETNQELYDKLQVTMSEKSLKGGEISILKRENEQLKSELENCRECLELNRESCARHMKENEQLRRKNKKLEEHLRRFYSEEEWNLKEALGDFE